MTGYQPCCRERTVSLFLKCFVRFGSVEFSVLHSKACVFTGHCYSRTSYPLPWGAVGMGGDPYVVEHCTKPLSRTSSVSSCREYYFGASSGYCGLGWYAVYFVEEGGLSICPPVCLCSVKDSRGVGGFYSKRTTLVAASPLARSYEHKYHCLLEGFASFSDCFYFFMRFSRSWA